MPVRELRRVSVVCARQCCCALLSWSPRPVPDRRRALQRRPRRAAVTSSRPGPSPAPPRSSAHDRIMASVSSEASSQWQLNLKRHTGEVMLAALAAPSKNINKQQEQQQGLLLCAVQPPAVVCCSSRPSRDVSRLGFLWQAQACRILLLGPEPLGGGRPSRRERPRRGIAFAWLRAVGSPGRYSWRV